MIHVTRRVAKTAVGSSIKRATNKSISNLTHPTLITNYISSSIELPMNSLVFCGDVVMSTT